MIRSIYKNSLDGFLDEQYHTILADLDGEDNENRATIVIISLLKEAVETWRMPLDPDSDDLLGRMFRAPKGMEGTIK